jgi:ABC-type Zn2+ transport system substrate-binding protein/surface adhesin
MPNGERKNANLEMAVALDDMDKTLSSANADFLERVLRTLKEGKEISPKDEGKLEALHSRYFPDNEEEEGEEEDDEKSNDDDDIDEDDFV